MTGRGTCEKCGKEVALYLPAGGDGSLLLTRRHRAGHRLPGQRGEKSACPGSYRAPDLTRELTSGFAASATGAPK